ncbi:glucosaminidase domain-containing protein [Sulfurimonas sp.]|jgi:Bax protein|uniref:glucosaminidase domain-containing protein n=1 Tax=Sulfurimonas sp. TaxID=2022749 RepID=UPI0026012FAF|nr:glucosaminidase domain-containing protein [Sulfurimonas sp.]MBT5935815.1 hypothetical protein [Sulfurimonas sp.]
MRYIFLCLLISLNIFALEIKPLYKASVIPKNMTVKVKKERFFALMVSPIQKVHKELLVEFQDVKSSLKLGINQARIEVLKKEYKVTSDKALLKALKPHSPSIVLAQAAMESAWATSRFFRQANNVFGMWSSNKNQPRIAAGEKRGGTKTIWLRKFSSLEESVREYYKVMGRGRAYKNFREYRYDSNDVFIIINGLDKYSEIGKKYIKELGSMIRYNKLMKYD